MESYCSTT